MVDAPNKCQTYGAKCVLVQTTELIGLYDEDRRKSHFKKISSIPIIEVRNNKILPFLHFLVFIIDNKSVYRILKELNTTHGSKRNPYSINRSSITKPSPS